MRLGISVLFLAALPVGGLARASGGAVPAGQGFTFALIALLLGGLLAYVLWLRSAMRRRARQSNLAESSWMEALEFSEDALCLIDLDDRLVKANRAFFQLSGKTPGTGLGEPFRDLFRESPDNGRCPVAVARRERRDARFIREAADPLNPYDHPVEVVVKVIRNGAGEATGILQVVRDLSRERANQATLRDSEARFRHLSAAAFEGIGVHRDGMIVDVNDALAEMTGYEREELIGSSSLRLAAEGSRPLVLERLQHHSDEPFEVDGLRKDGSTFRAELRGKDLHRDGEVLRVVAVRDISELAATRDALTRERVRLMVTLESIGDGVIVTDLAGRVEYLNPIAERLTGWSEEDARGGELSSVLQVYDDTGQPVADLVTEALQAEWVATGDGDRILRRRDGQEFAVEHSAAPMRGESGGNIGVVLVFRDVSAVRGMARQLAYQASHDSLTGLINRREFEHRLELALAEVREQPGLQDALCYMDLDQFKVVNDTCGHVAGDELLRQLASLLHSSLREHDVLARLGGDEFGLLLKDCPQQHAVDVTDSLRRTVREFRFVWEGRTFDVGVSIGLVMLNEHSPDVTGLLSAADSACYVAKDLGRNRIQVFHEADTALARHQGELQWVQRISRAVEVDRLVLYGQPIIPLQPDMEGPQRFEILVRMLDEEGELVPPMAFIPAAERYNVMGSVDRWVLRETLAIMADGHRAIHRGDLACAVNLSGQSISDARFHHYVLEQLRYFGVPPENLCFEVTETAAIANFVQAQRFLAGLREMGCALALDDFGSGLSSFGYLKNLPVDYLKIDGSFVRDMVEDPIDFAMVESINQLGHVMGIRTIAEYVETEAIREKLAALGVDYAQGYGVGGVAPLNEILFPTPAAGS